MKQCPSCRSTNLTLYMGGQFGKYECKKCGYVGALVLEKEDIKPKILVVGAGFGGLRAALVIKKLLKNKADVTVIDKSNVNVFIPALNYYLTSKLSKKNITVNLPKLLKNKGIEFLQGKVIKIDTKKKTVYVEKKTVAYDYLVIAIGSETTGFGIKGVDKYSYKYKTLKDVKKIKEKIKKLVNVRKKFTITIIGGGITGAQLSSHLRYYFDKKFPKHRVKISLLESSNRILSEMPEAVSKKVEKYFVKKNISMLFNSRVVKIEKNNMHLKSKQAIKSDLIIWTAGITIPEELENFNLDFCNRGIYVNKYFQTVSSQFVFAVGDCISFKDEKLERLSRKRAQTANKQGKHVAINIANHILNKKMIPYIPEQIPTLISLEPNSILHHKNVVIQNKLVSYLDHLIRLRQNIYYL